MVIGIKYAPEINVSHYKCGRTIEEVRKALEHPTDKFLNLPMACIYDFEKKSFIEFNKRYNRHKGKLIELIKTFKEF